MLTMGARRGEALREADPGFGTRVGGEYEEDRGARRGERAAKLGRRLVFTPAGILLAVVGGDSVGEEFS